MSLLVSWGDGENESRPLSTGTGWSGFGAWADTLDAATFREVVVLWEHGYTRRPVALAQQLDLALSQHPPTDPSVHDTAEGLLRCAREANGADHLAVTNGMTADDGGEDEWDEDADKYDPPDAPTAESLAARAVERFFTERGSSAGLVDKQVTVHRTDGSTFQQTRKVRTDAPAGSDGAHHAAELSGDEKHEIAAGIDKDVAAIPEDRRPEPGVIAKAKEIAFRAVTKAYFWVESVKGTRGFGLVAGALDGYLDNPTDMATKFGYNPTNSAQTASPQTADAVRNNLTDEFGFGVSGHLVAKIAATVIAKAVTAAKRKMAGAPASEATDTDDGYAVWAEFISQLFIHLNEQMGAPDGAPDAATVEKALRAIPPRVTAAQ